MKIVHQLETSLRTPAQQNKYKQNKILIPVLQILCCHYDDTPRNVQEASLADLLHQNSTMTPKRKHYLHDFFPETSKAK